MIYLLEDDDSIRKLVIYALQSQNFEAKGFDTPTRFWAAMREEKPKLVLLDIMLPEQDGISILQQLRAQQETRHLPVIIITAKNTEYDRVEGLDAGADDYISKPFGMMEMVSRVRAVLRRTDTGGNVKVLESGSLRVCPERHEVSVDGREVVLTYKEFQLICFLMENRGLVLTRDALMSKIWGLAAERENRTLDVHIRTLRAKLGSAGNAIETVRGVGYRFVEAEK
ncbi:MAG: response regulator transcription factor [Clostridia bacterium]|nr:response regulator transcription factor [Clostridia bacterium]MBQ2462743.1 response regulator transcription factor [Clostridia bacterium]